MQRYKIGDLAKILVSLSSPEEAYGGEGQLLEVIQGRSWSCNAHAYKGATILFLIYSQ